MSGHAHPFSAEHVGLYLGPEEVHLLAITLAEAGAWGSDEATTAVVDKVIDASGIERWEWEHLL